MPLDCNVENCPNLATFRHMCVYHRLLCKCTEDEDHPDCPVHEFYPGQWAYEATSRASLERALQNPQRRIY